MRPLARAAPFLVFVSILALTAVALAEASLQILARTVPAVERVLFPDHRQVRDRISDYDRNGFRNPEVPVTAEIVAIGDSQTNGEGVSSAEAWPKVLASLTGCEVYGMAVGGYGPLHYAELARDAITFRPSLIIVGVYFGNDFYDNWKLLRSNPNKYPVPNSLLRQAGKIRSPIGMKLFEASKFKPTKASSVWGSLASHSALWGFFRAIKGRLEGPEATILDPSFERAVSALTPQQLKYVSVFEGKGWRTILTARYRLVAEDSSDPRIAVGRWLTDLAVKDIQNTAQANGARLLFVLLPTKETVFASRVDFVNKHTYLERLVEQEALNRAYLIGLLSERDIPYIDARSILERLPDQPYWENADGHPNAKGHMAIANAINAAIPPCKRGD